MLTMKSGGGAPAETAANVYQPPPQQMAVMPLGAGPGAPVAQPAPAGDEEADAEEEKDEDDTAEDDQAQDQAQGVATPGSDAAQPNGGPKTPEQILQMLRQRPGQTQPGQPLSPPPPQQQTNDDNN
jgi:hypothetical protein